MSPFYDSVRIYSWCFDMFIRNIYLAGPFPLVFF